MSSNTPAPMGDPALPSSSREAWQDVGREFEALGATLAAAFRTARERTSSREEDQELRSGLQSMIDQVRHAVEETAAAPEGQQVREEAARAAERVRTAAEATVQEMRPALVAALRQVNEQLRRLTERLENEPPRTP